MVPKADDQLEATDRHDGNASVFHYHRQNATHFVGKLDQVVNLPHFSPDGLIEWLTC